MWICCPVYAKGNVGPKPLKQNALHSTREPLDPLTVGVKYSGLHCSFGVRISNILKKKINLTISDCPQLCGPMPMVLAPPNSNML